MSTRGNTITGTYLASAARTATPTPTVVANAWGRYLVVVIDATAATATPSVVFTVQGWDATAGKAWTLLASAAVTGTGTTVLQMGPGLPAAANSTANVVVPAAFRVDAVHGDSDSLTYSVTYHLIP